MKSLNLREIYDNARKMTYNKFEDWATKDIDNKPRVTRRSSITLNRSDLANTLEIHSFVKELQNMGYHFIQDPQGLDAHFNLMNLDNIDSKVIDKIKKLSLINPVFKFSNTGFYKKIFRKSRFPMHRLVVVRVNTQTGDRYFLVNNEGFKYCRYILEIKNYTKYVQLK